MAPTMRPEVSLGSGPAVTACSRARPVLGAEPTNEPHRARPSGVRGSAVQMGSALAVLFLAKKALSLTPNGDLRRTGIGHERPVE